MASTSISLCPEAKAKIERIAKAQVRNVSKQIEYLIMKEPEQITLKK
jgi:predicted transcriptional regulator